MTMVRLGSQQLDNEEMRKMKMIRWRWKEDNDVEMTMMRWGRWWRDDEDNDDKMTTRWW